MTKLLITGGCGFVGAAVCRRLLVARSDLSITVLDSLRRAGSETNRQSLTALGVTVVHGDIRLASDIDSLGAGLGSFDWVIDAAAEPSVLAGTAAGAAVGKSVSTRQLLEHNLGGTMNLLEAAARWNAGVILLSTSRVYSIEALSSLPLVEQENPARRAAAFVVDQAAAGGLPMGVGPAGITEQFSTAAPVSLYGATKLASETLAAEYAHRFGTPLLINRCGVMAGAGQFGRADQGIFSWWIRRWQARRPLGYIGFGGRGLQVRDCLHPDDLADLLLVQLATPPSRPAVVNVSGGADSAWSLAQLSAWCREQLGPHEVSASAETRPYDLAWVVLDHSQASGQFGWQPRRTTESILAEIAGVPA